MRRSHLFLLLLVLTPIDLCAQVSFVQTAGPGTNQTWSFAKGKNNLLLVATAKKVFRSTDNGGSWAPSNVDFDISTKGVLAFDPTGVIAYAMDNAGLSVSTDQGAHWTKITSLSGTNLFGIAVNATGHLFVGSYNAGVHVSVDAGLTWNTYSTGLPREPGVNDLYPMVRFVAAPNGHVFGIAQGGGLARTTDEGVTWTVVGDGVLPQSISGCAVSAAGKVFATGQGGIFVSTDDGSTWANIAGAGGLTVGSGGEIATDGTGTLVLLSAQGELWLSTDDGGNWSKVREATSDDHNALCITGAGAHYFDGTANNAVFASADNGQNWIPSSKGIVSSMVPAVATDSSGRLYAVADTNGLYVSNDFGDTWSVLNDTPFVTHNISSICAAPNGDLYATIYGIGPMQSTDQGRHWTNMTPNMPGVNKPYMLAVCSAPNGNIFTGGFNGTVYRSTNRGAGWTPKRSGIPTDTIHIIGSNTNGTIFAVCSTGVFSTTNNGDAWTAGTGSPSGVTAFATVGPVAFASNVAGIYASSDEGASWLKINGSIIGGTGIAAAKNGGGFYATTKTDLQYSADGFNWQPQIFPFATAPMSMIVDGKYGVIYVATAGSGLYRSPAPKGVNAVRTSPTPSADRMLQSYPNPFGTRTTVRYSVSTPSLVELRVTDVNGKVIRTLVSERQQCGEYEATFDAAELQLPSGVFLCSLKTNGVTTSVPIVHLAR